MTGSRVSNFLSGVLGGVVVLVLGTVLIATDVIETGDSEQVVSQEPIAQPVGEVKDASDGDDDNGGGEDGLTVQEIYDRDGPGVVFVQARVTQAQPESPFGQPQPRQGVSTGSGFVLDKQGYILTNAHVVAGAKEAGVRFTEESSLVEAKVIGSDLSTDLAVLKVDRDDAPKLAPLVLGDSGKARVGDPVVAIGNPFGYSRTVTTGIVSALQRKINAPNAFQIDDVIQTDASINPGSSGGPLIDARGQVIGINSQIATAGANGSVGIGFAVPINTAKKIVPQLKKEGKVDRAYLGITTTTVTKQLADDLNLPVDEGALVQEVISDGPADKAGLRAGKTELEGFRVGGDIIVKVDGDEVKRNSDVADAILDNDPGDEVEIEYFRGDDRKKAKVKLGTRPQKLDLEGPQGGGGQPSPDDILPFPLP